MKQFWGKLLSSGILLANVICFGQASEYSLPITPRPVSIVADCVMTPYVFKERTFVCCDEEFKKAGELLASRLDVILCHSDIKAANGQDDLEKASFIRISKMPVEPIQNDEAYALKITENEIQIMANTVRGAIWGCQTLLQMLPPNTFDTLYSGGKTKLTGMSLPLCKISDYPRFSYRGMHLDVCRHFFTVEEVKHFLDWMSTYKMNTLHWHLTDDQGWRIEIKKYPQLLKHSTHREESPQKGNRDVGDKTPYGPYYYTQEQIKEVIAYAAERGIEIIPEIEMPGHAQAVLAAFPELGCTGGPYKTWTKWGVSTNVFCAGNEQVFRFLQDVLDEVVALFPSAYIHLGGDECPKDKWKVCPKCRQKAKELNLRVNELQGYFMTRMVEYLKSKGKHAIGWDELLDDGKIPSDTIIMAWRGILQGRRAGERGFKAVMTPNEYLYFDYAQSRQPSEPETIGGICTIEGLYSYDPEKGIPKTPSGGVIGVQANCWSEYFFDFSCVEYAILPRITALSEVAWTPQEKRNYADFCNVLPSNLLRFDAAGANFRKIVFDLGPVYQFEEAVDINLEFSGVKCFMTSDGSEPSESNYIDAQQIRITKDNTILKYYFVFPSGKKSPMLTTRLEKLIPQEAIKVEVKESGLKYQTVKGVFKTVDQFDAVASKPWKQTATLAIGLPGEPVNMIGYIFEGYVYAPETGVYTIENTSDDGSVIWINQKKIVDNDGLHGASEVKRARIALKQGWHAVKVKYFDAGGGTSMNYTFILNNKPIIPKFGFNK